MLVQFYPLSLWLIDQILNYNKFSFKKFTTNSEITVGRFNLNSDLIGSPYINSKFHDHLTAGKKQTNFLNSPFPDCRGSEVNFFARVLLTQLFLSPFSLYPVNNWKDTFEVDSSLHPIKFISTRFTFSHYNLENAD